MTVQRIFTTAWGFVNYKNPFTIAYKRLFCSGSLMTIKDRATGVGLTCKVASYPMFPETWYYGHYDVPGCPLRPGDLVLDIGANQGFFTCWAAHKGCTVYALEPFRPSFDRLLANVEANGFGKRVTCEQLAVSDQVGEATLLVSDFLGGGANTLSAAHAKVSNHNGASVAVRCELLDSLIERHSLTRIRLCKLDCEGSELAILRAFKSFRMVDSFAMEIHPAAYPVAELVELILSWGTHQVSFAPKTPLMYAVRTDVLTAWAAECT